MGNCKKSLMTSLKPEKGKGKKNQSACDLKKARLSPESAAFLDEKWGECGKPTNFI